MPDPSPSRLLADRFQVDGPLAEGGMARVYAGTDRRTGAPVALKRVGPEGAARLAREALALARLDHPHIVRLLDHGSTPDGGGFLAMERVNGPSVLGWGRERAPVEIVRLLLQVVAALDHAHRAGVVHRDLKAANLLVAQHPEGPRAQLIDFGLALVDGAPPLADDEALLGSAHTAAPEQVKGGPVDARADLYAVGVLAFRLLSGRWPYHGKATAEVFSLHVHAPVPPLQVPGLPAGLDAVVARCLAKDPADRFPDAEALGAALQATLAPSSRRWGPWLGLALALLLLALGAWALR